MKPEEPKQTRHDCNAICPYCGHAYQVTSEDYTQTYERYTDFQITHYCTPKP